MRGRGLCQTSCNSLKFLTSCDRHICLFVVTWTTCNPNIFQSRRTYGQPCLNGRNVRIYLTHETSALHDCKSRFFQNGCASTSLICVSFFLRLVGIVLVMLRVNRRWRIVSRGLAKLLGSASSNHIKTPDLRGECIQLHGP